MANIREGSRRNLLFNLNIQLQTSREENQLPASTNIWKNINKYLNVPFQLFSIYIWETFWPTANCQEHLFSCWYLQGCNNVITFLLSMQIKFHIYLLLACVFVLRIVLFPFPLTSSSTKLQIPNLDWPRGNSAVNKKHHGCEQLVQKSQSARKLYEVW